MFKEYVDIQKAKRTKEASITGTPSEDSEHRKYFTEMMRGPKPERKKPLSPKQKKAASDRYFQNLDGTPNVGLGKNPSTKNDTPDSEKINSRQMGFHKMMLLLRLAKARRNGFRLNDLRSTKI
jgi:hypothetical protein